LVNLAGFFILLLRKLLFFHCLSIKLYHKHEDGQLSLFFHRMSIVSPIISRFRCALPLWGI
jgi:hypothetical protein